MADILKDRSCLENLNINGAKTCAYCRSKLNCQETQQVHKCLKLHAEPYRCVLWSSLCRQNKTKKPTIFLFLYLVFPTIKLTSKQNLITQFYFKRKTDVIQDKNCFLS